MKLIIDYFKKTQVYVMVMLLATLVVITLIIVAYSATFEFSQARAWMRHSQDVRTKLYEFQLLVDEAEKTRLRALLTNDEQYFAKYIVLSSTFQKSADEIKQLTSDNPQQQKRLQALNKVISNLAAAQNLSLGKQKELWAKNAKSENSPSSELFFNLNNQLSQILNAMQSVEKGLHIKRLATADRLLNKLKLAYLALTLFFTFLALLGYFLYLKIKLKRFNFQQSLVNSQALAHTNLENLSIMSEMSNLLLACRDTSESFTVIAHFAEKIIQSEAGAMYLYWESRNQLECKAQWGQKLGSQLVFEPSACWALRRGQIHIHDDAVDTIPCSHISLDNKLSTICIPISAQGIVQGALYFQREHTAIFIELEQHLLTTFASQVALALANMRLKDTLREQSVRDPLTGLFNRRFLEESLEQLTSNSARKNLEFGIVVLDVDHFKKFNDNYGHDAGDAILREIGQLLKKSMRGSDTVCRYGGEEFVIVYAECTIELVEKRCKQLLKSIEALNINYLGNPLGKVTASIGIAMYPKHGKTTEVLIREADAALYDAKLSGRNQLKIANLS